MFLLSCTIQSCIAFFQSEIVPTDLYKTIWSYAPIEEQDTKQAFLDTSKEFDDPKAQFVSILNCKQKQAKETPEHINLYIHFSSLKKFFIFACSELSPYKHTIYIRKHKKFGGNISLYTPSSNS